MPRADGTGRVPAVEVHDRHAVHPRLHRRQGQDAPDPRRDRRRARRSTACRRSTSRSSASTSRSSSRYEEALRWASNVDEFKLKVQGISTTADMARDQMASTRPAKPAPAVERRRSPAFGEIAPAADAYIDRADAARRARELSEPQLSATRLAAPRLRCRRRSTRPIARLEARAHARRPPRRARRRARTDSDDQAAAAGSRVMQRARRRWASPTDVAPKARRRGLRGRRRSARCSTRAIERRLRGRPRADDSAEQAARSYRVSGRARASVDRVCSACGSRR